MYNKMSTAPKDGTRILVWNVERTPEFDFDESKWMCVAWLQDYVNYPNSGGKMKWCVPESWQDEQGGYETADNPICWTELPKKLTMKKELLYK